MAPKRLNHLDIVSMYTNGFSVKEVAEYHTCTIHAIYRVLKKEGVELRPRPTDSSHDEGPLRTCVKCGEKKDRETFFRRNARDKTGRDRRCSSCEKKREIATHVYGSMADRNKAFLGRGNPNCRYPGVADDFFEKIDSEEKAYLLGWIASDGTVRVSGWCISIHQKDRDCLVSLRDLVDPKLPVKKVKRNMVSLTVNSRQMSLDLCRWLGTAPGKKSHTVKFPDLPEALSWAFLRGLFDGDGHVRSTRSAKGGPMASVTSNSAEMLRSVQGVAGGNLYATSIEWNGVSALDFLSRLYDSAGPGLRLRRKYEAYIDWCGWVPSLAGAGNRGEDSLLRWSKTDERAEAPFKERASDAGYDLTLISKLKTVGDVDFYDTGVKVLPAEGLFFMLVARSSFSKSGHALAHGVGIIDRSYRGTIIVPVRRLDPDAPEIKLPARCVQILPSLSLHYPVVEVAELPSSDRGERGFGSTGN